MGELFYPTHSVEMIMYLQSHRTLLPNQVHNLPQGQGQRLRRQVAPQKSPRSVQYSPIARLHSPYLPVAIPVFSYALTTENSWHLMPPVHTQVAQYNMTPAVNTCYAHVMARSLILRTLLLLYRGLQIRH